MVATSEVMGSLCHGSAWSGTGSMGHSDSMTERLFVALWPEPQVVEAVRRQLEPIQDRYRELRWQTPDRWHLTLAFLVSADATRRCRACSESSRQLSVFMHLWQRAIRPSVVARDRLRPWLADLAGEGATGA